MGQIVDGPADVGHLAVGRELLGNVLAVDDHGYMLPALAATRSTGRPEFERANARCRLEEVCLQTELLAQLLQQVVVFLLHQRPQVFDAAAALLGGRCSRFTRALAAGTEVALGLIDADGLVGGIAHVGRQFVGDVHAVGAVEQQPQRGTLLALDRERENRFGQQEQHLAKHGGPQHEQHEPPAVMPVGLMAEIEKARREHHAHAAEQQQHRRPLRPEGLKAELEVGHALHLLQAQHASQPIADRLLQIHWAASTREVERAASRHSANNSASTRPMSHFHRSTPRHCMGEPEMT